MKLLVVAPDAAGFFCKREQARPIDVTGVAVASNGLSSNSLTPDRTSAAPTTMLRLSYTANSDTYLSCASQTLLVIRVSSYLINRCLSEQRYELSRCFECDFEYGGWDLQHW